MAANSQKPTASRPQKESKQDTKQEQAQEALKEEIKKSDQANENDRQAMFNVYLFDPVSKTSQMGKFVSIGSINNIKSATLAEIRKSLISENALSWRQKSSKFCNDEGAEVDDKLRFDMYLDFLTSSEETPADSKGSNDNSKANESKKTKGNNGQPANSNTGKSYKVYLKLRKFPTEMHETTRDFLKKELDLQMAKPDTISADVNKLTSSYNHKDFMALAAKTVTIPRFLVQDDSYINVSENKSSVADAIADSSLSEHSAEVSVGGGAFGVSAGVKVGYKKEDSAKAASNTTKDTKRMTITYNFPRVVLELDGDSLDISDECKKDLEAISTAEGVQYFRRKYGTLPLPHSLDDDLHRSLSAGTFFATRVELGGRLHSSESSDSFAEGKVEEKARSLKISAAASFSSAYAQGSASGSYGTANNNSKTQQNSSLNNSLSWEAKGGDTLLCNNPPAWCGTVASYYNWRISKQDDLLSIEDMISLIPGYESTKRKFDSLSPPKVDGIPKPVEPVPKEWDGWVTFWLKHPNEYLYPTVVEESNPVSQALANLTPSQAEWYKKHIPNYTSTYCFKMMESNDKDYPSQMFQAGYKFFEIYDGNTVKYRFKPGQKYILKNNKVDMYLGATLPIPGGTQRSVVNTASWETCAYFQFTHAFENDKMFIANRDLVRVEIFDAAGKPIGPLKDLPPLGSYGTTGDIFVFRYRGEP
ncbi:hypothetical protein BBP40_007351 [Aspergillus hancockii]|nr:hypothetical protein BBP40_007351 [Aspergillus hancockii]